MTTPEPVSPIAPPLRGPVLMGQDWCDLTFVHWAVDPARVASLMPPGVRPDELDGRTYVGLVPFRMVDAGVGRGPGVPWLGTFLETNVRLYSVDATGRRGVVFLSLDCDRLLVVAGARLGFGVPYRWARMRHQVRRVDGRLEHTYDSVVRGGRGGAARAVVRVGDVREPDVVDHFVSARWGLHSRLLGRTLYIPNEHPPWPLHDATLLDLRTDVLAGVGLPDLVGRTPDHVAFSPGVRTEFGFPGDARQPRRTD